MNEVDERRGGSVRGCCFESVRSKVVSIRRCQMPFLSSWFIHNLESEVGRAGKVKDGGASLCLLTGTTTTTTDDGNNKTERKNTPASAYEQS